MTAVSSPVMDRTRAAVAWARAVQPGPMPIVTASIGEKFLGFRVQISGLLLGFG
jgi:hypothetical protein